MPTRRRVSKRRTLNWKARGTSWSLHRWVEHWGSVDAAREAREMSRDELTRHRRRPPPFWAYEEGVPDKLRHKPRFDIRVEGEFAAMRRFDLQRFRWLVAAGRLLPGEEETIRDHGGGDLVEILDELDDP